MTRHRCHKVTSLVRRVRVSLCHTRFRESVFNELVTRSILAAMTDNICSQPESQPRNGFKTTGCVSPMSTSRGIWWIRNGTFPLTDQALISASNFLMSVLLTRWVGSAAAFTLTVSVASNAGSTLTNSATVAGGGETNTSNDTATDSTTMNASSARPSVSDNFNNTTLNTALWTFVNPLGDGSYQMTGTHLQLSVPAGTRHDLWTDGENAVRVMQPVSNSNFAVEAKFDSTVNTGYQMQGILVEQDSTDFLRLEVLYNGSLMQLLAASIIGSNATFQISQTLNISR